MKKMKQNVSLLVAATLLATLLSGCSLLGVTSEQLEGPVISEDEVIGEEAVIDTESVIGEGTGSGELVSLGSGTYEADEIDGIEVRGDALAIFVSRGAGDQAEVELLLDRNIDSNKITFTSEVKSGTLKVTLKEKSRTIGKDQSGERRLMITLPDKTYNKLNITSAFGQIEVQDIAAEQITAKIEAGQIVMNEVRGELDVEAEAGEISLNGIVLENDLSAKSSVGLVSVSLAEAPAAAEVSMSSEIGTVTSELEELDVQEQRGNKLKGKIGTGGPKLTLKSSVGSVELKVAS
ncbi:DUF4097 family beta strand repeat-containing protein [Paenibacillus sp. CAU 1782]